MKKLPLITLFICTNIIILNAQEKVGINMRPEAGLDVTSPDPRLFRLNNKNREQIFEINEVGNVGLNIEASPNHETFIIKPGLTTSAFEEVLDIRNNAGLSIFAVEEEGHIGIQTNTPKTKLHVAGGNGDVLATHGDFILGNTNVGLRFGIYTSGLNAGTASISSVGSGTDRIEIGGDGQPQLIVDTKNDRFGFGTQPNVFMDMETDGPAVQRLRSMNSSANLYLDGSTGSSIQFYQNNIFSYSMINYDHSNNSINLYNFGNVLTAANGQIFLPHLAGYGNRDLRVNNNGQVSPKSFETYSLGCIDFLKIVHGYGDSHRVDFSNGNVRGDSNNSNSLYCPINLPDNTLIKTIILHFVDDASNNLVFEIVRVPVSSGSIYVLTDYTSNMDVNAYQRITLNETITIDNDNFTYYISVKPETDGGWYYENEGFLSLRSVQFSENPNF
jgi:hypothetical protein